MVYLLYFALSIANGLPRWVPSLVFRRVRSLLLETVAVLWVPLKASVKCLYFSKELLAFRVLDIEDRPEVVMASSHVEILKIVSDFVELLSR